MAILVNLAEGTRAFETLQEKVADYFLDNETLDQETEALLPEYVTILVSYKRSRADIEAEVANYIPRYNAAKFTSWLAKTLRGMQEDYPDLVPKRVNSAMGDAIQQAQRQAFDSEKPRPSRNRKAPVSERPAPRVPERPKRPATRADRAALEAKSAPVQKPALETQRPEQPARQAAANWRLQGRQAAAPPPRRPEPDRREITPERTRPHPTAAWGPPQPSPQPDPEDEVEMDQEEADVWEEEVEETTPEPSPPRTIPARRRAAAPAWEEDGAPHPLDHTTQRQTRQRAPPPQQQARAPQAWPQEQPWQLRGKRQVQEIDEDFEPMQEEEVEFEPPSSRRPHRMTPMEDEIIRPVEPPTPVRPTLRPQLEDQPIRPIEPPSPTQEDKNQNFGHNIVLKRDVMAEEPSAPGPGVGSSHKIILRNKSGGISRVVGCIKPRRSIVLPGNSGANRALQAQGAGQGAPWASSASAPPVSVPGPGANCNSGVSKTGTAHRILLKRDKVAQAGTGNGQGKKKKKKGGQVAQKPQGQTNNSRELEDLLNQLQQQPQGQTQLDLSSLQPDLQPAAAQQPQQLWQQQQQQQQQRQQHQQPTRQQQPQLQQGQADDLQKLDAAALLQNPEVLKLAVLAQMLKGDGGLDLAGLAGLASGISQVQDGGAETVGTLQQPQQPPEGQGGAVPSAKKKKKKKKKNAGAVLNMDLGSLIAQARAGQP